METSPSNQLYVINVVLSITISVGTVLYDFILWKLSQIFSTKAELAKLERTVEEQTRVIIQLQIRMAKSDTPKR